MLQWKHHIILQIHKGVKQGCPLAPYLFFIVGKIFNLMFKEVMKLSNVKRIWLLKSRSQQTLSQYVNDTTFTVLRESAQGGGHFE